MRVKASQQIVSNTPLVVLSGSDRAATHGSPRQVYGNERDGPASAEYESTLNSLFCHKTSYMSLNDHARKRVHISGDGFGGVKCDLHA